jgi:hypothetical protein
MLDDISIQNTTKSEGDESSLAALCVTEAV